MNSKKDLYITAHAFERYMEELKSLGSGNVKGKAPADYRHDIKSMAFNSEHYPYMNSKNWFKFKHWLFCIKGNDVITVMHENSNRRNWGKL